MAVCSNFLDKNSIQRYSNYPKSYTYTAARVVSSMRLGNGKWESTQFNSRLQPTQIGLGASASTQNLLKLNFDYGTTDNNGNVKSQQITVPTVGTNQGFTAVQTYTYDSLNRLKDAKELIGTSQTWKQTFTFDRYGNRNFDTANNNTTTLLPGCPTAVCNPAVNQTNNRLIGYTFDTSGNTTLDAENRTFIYDAENKQVQVNNAQGIVGQYVYDGDGKRIKKTVPNGETVIFVYDAAGKLVAEYANQISQTPQVSYLTSDHLGSPRINIDATGAVIARHDYLPFGEEITGTGGRTAALGYAADDVRKKFTGYERDTETELDFAQARYFESGIGRFSSPDYFANDTQRSAPQSWNLYVYVRNNPLKYVDRNGKELFVVVNNTSYKVVQEKRGNYRLENNDGSNGNVQASEAFINRLATKFGSAVDNLVTGTQYSTINVNNDTGSVNATSVAYLDNGTVTSTTSSVGITGQDDESFVGFSTELLVANELVSSPSPFEIHSQNLKNGSLIVNTTQDGGFTGGAFQKTRNQQETQIRTGFDINPNPLNFGRFDLGNLPPLVAPPPVFVGNPNGGTGADPSIYAPSKPEKPLPPPPCLRGQPPGCRQN